MNSLNALGNRQVASLNADLQRMESGEGGSNIQGQITTTLAALSRLIDDYDSMARKEMVAAAREKANTRVEKLKGEHKSLKTRFEKAKNAGDMKNRNELLGMSSATGSAAGPSGGATQRRAANGADAVPESPFGHSGYQPNYTSREDFALREHSFIRESESLLDGYIAQGTLALQDLVEQRGILKKTHKKLLDAAHTLGMSRETIGWVERRTTQDWFIFFGGAAFTLLCFWLIYHYLG